MKSVCAMEPGRIEVVDDVPMPEIEKYECLVKVIATGFCNGTDLKIIQGKIGNLTVPFPALVGHEGVGEVVEVGTEVRNWAIGDRMINAPFCLMPGTPYGSMWGGMSEYAVVPDAEVVEELGLTPRIGAMRRIPRDIDPQDAALILSLKEALSAVRNFGFQSGMDALVYGDGPMGLALVRFLRLEGAGWVGCVGHWDDRLERARELGEADATANSKDCDIREWMGERRVNLVIDAVGSPEIIHEAGQLVHKGGKVGVTGVLSKEHSSIDLLALPHHTCVHVLTFPYREHDVQDEIVELVRNGTLDPKHYYSHVLPLDEAPKAMELVVSREAFKVVLVP